jgi:L-rhamnose mutarotase
MALMAADPETQRWWKETEPCQLPISDDEGAASSWSDTDPIYYQP